MKRLHIFVSGMVQGVFFRQSTLIKAEELGLKGWVKNLRDKRVELVCEGHEDSLHAMIVWCGKGPNGAFVESLDTLWEEFKGEFNSFKIVY